MSWKAEVQVARDPKWYDNAVRLETKAEAEAYAEDLFNRWTVAEQWRVAESDDAVTANWVDGRVVWKEVKYTQTTVDDHDL
jgi:hypothetical protein